MIARLLTWVQTRYLRGEFDPASENSDSFDRLPRTYVIRDLDGDPYLTRTVFPRVFGVRPLLHRFHRPDGDRHLHNHPWTRCLSIVLSGSYDEERLNTAAVADIEAQFARSIAHGKEKWGLYHRSVVRPFPLRVRFWNFIRHGDYHRITRLRGEVFTLFLTGRRVSDWGFFTECGHVGHADYFAAKAAARELRGGES